MRRKRRVSKNGKSQVFIMVFVTVLAVFAYAMAYNPAIFGVPAANVTSFINMFPGLIVTSIGIYFLSEAKGQGKFAGFLSVGAGLCILVNYMNAEGLWTAQLLNGLTVPQLQLWIMVVSVLSGAVFFSFSH